MAGHAISSWNTTKFKIIATIEADPGGEDITIIQGADNLIDILDNNNGGASLTPSGGPEAIRGIIFKGEFGDDVTTTRLQNGNTAGAGFIVEPSLPEGLIIQDQGGTNTHTIEAVAKIVTIGKKFELFEGGGDDILNLKNVSRTNEFTCYGDTGIDTLDIQEPSVIQLQADYFTGIVKYIDGISDDTLTLSGTVGGAISLIGGAGVDTFSVTAFNAGVLTAKIGGDADEITTLGVFKGLKLDAQDAWRHPQRRGKNHRKNRT